MRSILASAICDLLASFATVVKLIVKLIAIHPTNAYRPEAHYMRGPGPAWRAKHAPPSATR